MPIRTLTPDTKVQIADHHEEAIARRRRMGGVAEPNQAACKKERDRNGMLHRISFSGGHRRMPPFPINEKTSARAPYGAAVPSGRLSLRARTVSRNTSASVGGCEWAPLS